ncbi:unnamed protein product [Owenia fusiformis]|uniref:Uncharacterized protein n=1 Tax=Owenia fusiformis TaxID=6347 RepID=A0A8J1TBS0_OWEFU|nr:unnamed protein product [Owenia fusiformis]
MARSAYFSSILIVLLFCNNLGQTNAFFNFDINQCPSGCVCKDDSITCRDIRQMPKFSNTTKRIELVHCYIPTIFTHDFENATSLEELVLDNVNDNGGSIYGGGTKLDSNCFSKLTKLKKLVMLNTKLFMYSSDYFDNLTNLEHLVMNNVGLGPHLLQSLFQRLFKLTHLDLGRNWIEFMPRRLVANFRNLKVFKINNNILWSPNAALTPISEASDLVELDLTDNRWIYPHNQFDKLPSVFQSFSKLKKLSIGKNKFEKLGRDFFADAPPSLEHISVEAASIKDIHNETLRPLKSLKFLDVSSNHDIKYGQFRTLLGSLAVKSKLTTLIMRDHKIDTFQASMFPSPSRVSSLKSLDMSGGDLKTLNTDAFKRIQGIEELQLHGNKLTDIPKGVFSVLSNLKVLSLASNNIMRFHQSSLRTNRHLEDLDISGNKLQSLAFGLLAGKRILKTFKAGGNNISVITKKHLENIRFLEHLDMKSNNVKTFKWKHFEKLNHLKEIDFSGNPLVCDCSLHYFRHWLGLCEIEILNKEETHCHQDFIDTYIPLDRYAPIRIECPDRPESKMVISTTNRPGADEDDIPDEDTLGTFLSDILSGWWG